jgi:choline dehydrogenase-like flavoprotein
MGNDPKRSVLNRFCQAHEMNNLYVTDGAAWVSSGCQNPTLTMMALTVRSCEHILANAARG